MVTIVTGDAVATQISIQARWDDIIFPRIFKETCGDCSAIVSFLQTVIQKPFHPAQIISPCVPQIINRSRIKIDLCTVFRRKIVETFIKDLLDEIAGGVICNVNGG